MKIHLVDGTYELFRAHFGAPSARGPGGQEVGAARGLVRSLLALLHAESVTHVACAFDTVIESFRNQLYAGYKTGEGVPEELRAQFPLADRATRALGIVVWPILEFETDDALATAAARWASAPGVEQVLIATADKDLAQCVRGSEVVCLDRMRGRLLDEPGVVAKFGVEPSSMPDWLALVGDSADGIPGVPRWGRKSASTVLARYQRLEDIPNDPVAWRVRVRGAAALAKSLREHRRAAELYRTLATLRLDVPLRETLEDLRWRGARRSEVVELASELGEPDLADRITLFRS